LRFASLDDGALVLRHYKQDQQTVTAYVEAGANGESRKVPVQIRQTTRVNQYTQIDPRHISVSTADGRPVEAARLKDLLVREISVLVSSDGRAVDPFWLQNVKPASLVVVAPLAAPPVPVYGAPIDHAPQPYSDAPQAAVGAPVPTPPAALGEAAPALGAGLPTPPPGRPQVSPSALGGAVSDSKAVEGERDFLSKQEREMLDLANRERARAGRPPLKASRQLSEAARRHAENMARRGVLNHTLDGRTFDQRISDTGYNFSAAGENIFMGGDAAAAIAFWMRSPGHQRNLLSSEFKEIGIGASTGAQRPYWTQVFATPVDRR
jgi:uncharacterized protein YkwD